MIMYYYFQFYEFYYLKSGDIIYVEPRNAVKLRSSSAQTFISAASNDWPYVSRFSLDCPKDKNDIDNISVVKM